MSVFINASDNVFFNKNKIIDLHQFNMLILPLLFIFVYRNQIES